MPYYPYKMHTIWIRVFFLFLYNLIKEEIVDHSNDVYILADSSKFDQVFAVTFTKLKGKCIITDRLDNDLYRKHAIVKEANK